MLKFPVLDQLDQSDDKETKFVVWLELRNTSCFGNFIYFKILLLRNIAHVREMYANVKHKKTRAGNTGQ